MKRMAVVVMVAFLSVFTTQTVWASSDFVAEFEKFINESWKQINSAGVKVDSPECKEANLGHDDSQSGFVASTAYRAALMCAAQYAGPLAEQGVSQRALLRKMHGKVRDLKLQYDQEVSVSRARGIRIKSLGDDLARVAERLAETEKALDVERDRRVTAEKSSSARAWILTAALILVFVMVILLILKSRKSVNASPRAIDSEDAADLTDRLGRVESDLADMRGSIEGMDERVATRLEPVVRHAAEGGAKARAQAILAEQISAKAAEGDAEMVASLTRVLESIS